MRLSFVFAAALVCASPTIGSAQVQVPSRGWVDINVVAANPHQGSQEFTTIGISATGLPATVDTSIPALGTVIGAGAEAGFNFAKGIGVGVRYEEARWEYSSPITVVASHPAFLFGTAMANVTADDLERRERTIDFPIQWTAPINHRVTIRMFAGPSLHFVQQDMVSNVEFASTFDPAGTLNGVAIVGYEQRQVEASTVGFHVGGDVSVFISRHIGVGVGVRRNHATVDITDPLSNQPADLSLTRFTLSAGLRLRF